MSNIGYIDYGFMHLHVFCVVVADIVYKCYNTAPDPVSSKNNLQYRKYLHTIIISYSYVPYVEGIFRDHSQKSSSKSLYMDHGLST